MTFFSYIKVRWIIQPAKKCLAAKMGMRLVLTRIEIELPKY